MLFLRDWHPVKKYHIVVLGTSKLADIRNCKTGKNKTVCNISPWDPPHNFQLQITHYMVIYYLSFKRETKSSCWLHRLLLFSYNLYFNHGSGFCYLEASIHICGCKTIVGNNMFVCSCLRIAEICICCGMNFLSTL